MIDAIRRHIALYASPARLERDAYLLALARSLDELAHAYHQLSAAAPADGPDVPQEDRRKLRQLVLERFPELSPDGDEQIAWTSDSRDPIDDAADLLSQMRESVWRWEHLARPTPPGICNFSTATGSGISSTCEVSCMPG